MLYNDFLTDLGRILGSLAISQWSWVGRAEEGSQANVGQVSLDFFWHFLLHLIRLLCILNVSFMKVKQRTRILIQTAVLYFAWGRRKYCYQDMMVN